jgi:hypothetical protein
VAFIQARIREQFDVVLTPEFRTAGESH